MGCGCGQSTPAVGRDLITSGDYQAPTPGEPLAVLAPDEPAPDGARYRVVNGTTVAYFDAHVPAFGWQQTNGGKLRTV